MWMNKKKHNHVDEQEKTQSCGCTREITLMWMNRKKPNCVDEQEKTQACG